MLRALPVLLLLGFAPAPDEPGMGDLIWQHARDYQAGAPITLLMEQHTRPDTEVRHTFTAEAGKRYLVAAVCGFDCLGIDLWAEDKAGNVIDREEHRYTDPLLVFETKSSGPITVVIGMSDCDLEAGGCGYSVGVFPLPPAAPKAPVDKAPVDNSRAASPT